MAQTMTPNATAASNAVDELAKHAIAVDTMDVTNTVRLRLKLDPADGCVIRRDVDVEVNWGEIVALEARMLASRSA